MQKIRIIGFFFENRQHCSVYLRLNLSNMPDLKFWKSQHCNVLEPITDDFKACLLCRILDKFTRRAKPIRITSVGISGEFYCIINPCASS